MTLYLNPSKEYKERMARSIALHQMKENWAKLLEVIFEDSTLEEILIFALRLDEIPHYTREEESAREFNREGCTHKRRFETVGGVYGNTGSYWEEHTEEPVTLLELPEKLIKKGSKSWKIEI